MLLDDVKECSKCGICRAVCPVFQEINDEIMSPRGRISLVEAMLEKKIGNNKRFIDTIQTCIKCTRCTGVCPSGVRVENIVQSARELLADNIILPESVRAMFKSNLFNPSAFKVSLIEASESNPDEKKSGIPLWILPLYFHEGPNIPKIASETILEKYPEYIKSGGIKKISLFVGCSINYVNTCIAESTIEVLKNIGIDIFLPKNQLCCGLPALFMGDKDTARQLAKQNLEAMKADDVDAVITMCPACGVTLTKEYEGLLNKELTEFKLKVYDISSFIVHLKIFRDSEKQRDLAVTYHDPCYLKLGQMVDPEPRRILRHVARFIEMKEPDKCCGLGCTMGIFHPEISMKMAEAKVNSIIQSGADIVATGCPGCIDFLKEQLAERNIKKEVLHTMQILHRSLA